MEKIQKGMIIRCDLNGLADFYEVVEVTNETVTLAMLFFEFCKSQDGKNDPAYSWVKIYRDNDGRPIHASDCVGGKSIHRKKLTYKKNGQVTFRSPNYGGRAKISVCESDFQKIYWAY